MSTVDTSDWTRAFSQRALNQGAAELATILERVRADEASLHDLTNWREHVAALDRGDDSALRFEV